MRIITGDECGLVKETIPELSRENEASIASRKLSGENGVSIIGNPAREFNLNMSRARGVVKLTFCDSQLHENGALSFGVLRLDGSLERWEGMAPCKSKEDKLCGGSYKIATSMGNIFSKSKLPNNDTNDIWHQGRPIEMCRIPNQNLTRTSNIVACCSSIGSVAIVDLNKMDEGVKTRYDAFSKNHTSCTILNAKGNFLNKDTATAMDVDHDGKRIVVGGRERSITLTDVESGKSLWKAKNLPPNPQTLLQQLIWSTTLQFLSQTDTAPICESTNLLAVGTAYKQLQIYDVRVNSIQRRPIAYTPEWDSNKTNLLNHRITSLCQLDSSRILVGDTAGYMNTLDLRKLNNQHGRSSSANVGRFCGPTGSVRQILKHESLPVIACIGLDRMLRTFDINTRRQLDCVYLKQRLNCMLFCADDTWMSTSSMLDEDDTCDQPNHVEILSSKEIVNEEDKIEEYFDSSDDENQSRSSNDTKYKIASEQNDDDCDGCLDKNVEESESSAEDSVDENIRTSRKSKRRRR